MYVSMNWIKDYVNINIDTNEFADKMTMSGSMVEKIDILCDDIKNVVVGHIESITQHPNADKLVVCQVNVGDEKLQIVTGATNVSEGDYIPVAVHGAILPGGLKIKKGKLRGEISEGMLCSADELGIPKAMIPEEIKDGIWILDKAYPLGQDITETLNLKDQVIEFEITSNRPDCLSVIGMAREVGATLNENVQYPNVEVIEIKDKASDHISVEIQDNEGCTRYVARVIKNIKIGSSPQWIQQRLINAGVRPINNIVDITNYVMLEYGQPLHAFDLSYIEGNKIVVKRAKDDELFKTLDGVERKLKSSMTVIADEKKSLAIAGVMGGEQSEVTENTKTILLESAHFSSNNIRLTSKQLALRTEASSRYEKGVDPNIARLAADRACQLIVELGAGEVLEGVVDIYPEERMPRQVIIRPKKINDLLGISLSNEEMIDIFNRLEITTKDLGDTLEVTVPTYRMDLVMEADFAEEVGRIFGYDKIPPTMAKGNIEVGGKPSRQIIADVAKDLLNAMGFNEILTYSFVSPKTIDMINLDENSIKRNMVKLINPLGDETSVMRTSLLPNILEVAARNTNRKVEDFRAFEIGQIFITKTDKMQELPLEIPSLVMAMYGKEDFFTLKGIVETLLDGLGIKEYEFIVEKNNSSYHPGRCANVIVQDRVLGTIGELHPIVIENYDLNQRCYCGELDFSILADITNMERLYESLPKYPAITRDFAVVVKDDVLVKEIEDIIKAQGGDILESFKLFDVYQGSQIKDGFKSIAYTITYRNKERTLTDDEVNVAHNRILADISKKLDGALRE
ncbi:phenylalanine--tRNA ligase subunit beta [Alkaliphilus sp. B6464]|uniref:phenylalanine--tRNA ligase subunit beta n=1 Tax=Alkaliphilus sp. B6464 TaxID=2731219 RepID=UPI001BAC7757|nr:phenylalanine--tRNA ligase subunit beta [Alkaliphilus sp. B6464]QUH20284.1 phenylalanine--tRNA ligase subunit beta [Alkaliphilus sp. B6464]